MELTYGITFAILVWHVISEVLHRKREKELLNRIMSKNYEEYEYYEKKYKNDLGELNKIRDEARDERKDEAKNSHVKMPEKELSLGQFEEDWNEDEVDKEALKEQERDG